jgi:hypothetical protein
VALDHDGRKLARAQRTQHRVVRAFQILRAILNFTPDPQG